IYYEASSTFYANSYFILALGRHPIDGIDAFVEKIGTRNMKMITRIAIYRGSYYAQEYRSDTALSSYTWWAPRFGSHLQELRLVYDQINLDHLQRPTHIPPGNRTIYDYLGCRTSFVVEGTVTIKPSVGFSWPEPSTYRLDVSLVAFTYEPIGEHKYEALVGTGEKQTKVVLRYSDREDCGESVK
ncbi:MAG: hypothetical protein Q9169_008723, partial [Polycauliona sp. 2 TL-2023]